MHSITKEFCFEAAHLLSGHEGACINLHGHSYRLLVTVSGGLTRGMVTDFSTLKQVVTDSIISKIDHSFIFDTTSKDEAEQEIADTLQKHNRRVFPIEGRPTAEHMARLFFDTLKPLMPSNCAIKTVTLYETKSSFCSYSEE